MENKFTVIEKLIMLIFGLLAFGLVSGMDYQDEKDNELYYCKMVAQWERDRKAGKEWHERHGWPATTEQRRQNCLKMTKDLDLSGGGA